MLRTSVALAAATAALLPLAAATSTGAATPTRKCANYYFAPMYKHVTKITVKNGSCTTGRRVVGAYERAIVSSTNISQGTTTQGVCFGRHSYGPCTVTYAGRKYRCNRPVAGGTTVPAVCKRGAFVVHFKG